MPTNPIQLMHGTTITIADEIDGHQWQIHHYPDNCLDTNTITTPIYIKCITGPNSTWLDTGEKDLEKVTQQLKVYGSDYYEFIQTFGPRNSHRKYKRADT